MQIDHLTEERPGNTYVLAAHIDGMPRPVLARVGESAGLRTGALSDRVRCHESDVSFEVRIADFHAPIVPRRGLDDLHGRTRDDGSAQADRSRGTYRLVKGR